MGVARPFGFRVMSVALGSIVLSLVVGSCGSGATGTGESGSGSPQAAPDSTDVMRIVIYDGPAACSDCAEAAATWLSGQLPDATIELAGPDEPRAVDATTLAGADLYVQPGGGDDVAQAYDDLGPIAASAITDYVRGGGRYLGICMGAFLAGSDPGLSLLSPADTGGYIDLPDAAVRDDRDTLVPVTWDGQVVQAYFQDGSYIDGDLDGIDVVATYTDGPPVAVVDTFGAGVVGVIGTHPEAPLTWYDEAGLATDERAGNQAVGNDLLRRILTR